MEGSELKRLVGLYLRGERLTMPDERALINELYRLEFSEGLYPIEEEVLDRHEAKLRRDPGLIIDGHQSSIDWNDVDEPTNYFANSEYQRPIRGFSNNNSSYIPGCLRNTVFFLIGAGGALFTTAYVFIPQFHEQINTWVTSLFNSIPQ